MCNYDLGVEKGTLELLRTGKYEEVFTKPTYIQKIFAHQSGTGIVTINHVSYEHYIN